MSRVWHCTLFVITTLLVLGSSYSARGEDNELLSHFRGNFERVNNMADALHDSINQVGETGSKIVEVRGKDEIADSVDQGREVTVFVLHRQFHVGDETHDLVDSVSPHPFPQFLSTPGTSYRVEETHVVGTGAYRKLGLQPYAAVEDLTRIPYPTDQPIMRAAPDEAEKYRLYGQWNAYRSAAQQRELYPTSPDTRSELRDAAAGEVRLLAWDVPTARQRAAILALESNLASAEAALGEQMADFKVSVSDNTENADLSQVRRDQQAMLERLQSLRGYLDGISELGGSFGLTREDSGYYRELRALSPLLNARVAAYRNAAALQEEAQRLDKQKRERRLTLARRKAWDYLVAVVGAACADPTRVAAMTEAGKISGIELSSVDFDVFFADDSTTRDDLVGLVTGEAFARLNSCQEEILRQMIDRQGPISTADVVTLAQQYRTEHPTLLNIIGKQFDALGQALSGLRDALTPDLNDVGTSKGQNNSATESTRGERESVGTYERHAPNIDLQRPDFGASTLGH